MKGNAGRSRIDVLGLAFALLLALAVALPLWPGGFMTDDFHGLRMIHFGPQHAESAEPDVPASLVRLLCEEAVPRFRIYRPVVPLSFALDLAIWGLDPRGWLITDVLLRLVGVVLLWSLIGALLPGVSPISRAFATALFAASPVQLEVLAWSSARSDSLSWIFGCAALLTKLRAPQRTVAPALLAATALLAKESALVFLVLLVLIDVFDPLRPSRLLLRERLPTALRRALPLVVLAALYVLVRLEVFGSLMPRYGGRDLAGEFSLADQTARLLGSLLAVLVPLSRAVFTEPDGPLRLIAALAFGLGWLLVLPLGALALLFRPRGTPILVALLLALPLALGVVANPIGDWLVNTRAAFTPFAALALLAAASTTAPRGGRTARAGLALLVAVSLAVAVPTAAAYARAKEGIAISLESLRGRLAELPETTARVAVLGYVEDDYFGGGFTVSGGLAAATKRPFVGRDRPIALVRADAAVAGAEHLTALPELDRDDRGSLAILVPTSAADGPHRYEIVHPGAVSSTPDAATTTVAPVSGTTLTFDAADETTLSFDLVWRSGERGVTRWHLLLVSAAGLVGSYPIPGVATPSAADQPMRFTVRLPAEVVSALPPRAHQAFALHGLDADGTLIAASELAFIQVESIASLR